jgi:hypothetical protein
MAPSNQELPRPLAALPANDPSRRFHGTLPPRGLDNVPRSTLYEGKFGRMFRNLPALEPADADLEALAATMVEATVEEGDLPAGDDPAIAAGFTYVGQFLDHDITFDPLSQLMRQNDPDALNNFRTPRFDLDSVYGAGPSDSPFLYEADGIRFVIGQNEAGEDDLPRNQPQSGGRRALIGDPRNDENLIVSQLHLAVLKFYNKVADTIAAQPNAPTGPALFEAARRTVQWHYQWAVVHDFLPTIVGAPVVNNILKNDAFVVGTGGDGGSQQATVPNVDLKFFHWKNKPFMPVEFAVAAYRFGHSLIRADYEMNQDDQDIPIFQAPPTSPTGDLRGFRERPADREIDWRRFFDFGGAEPEVQLARRIDTKVSHGLGHLPVPVIDSGPVSLAERNLKRGKALGLPSGQAVAAAMGIPAALRLKDADFVTIGLPAGLRVKFKDATPLWYYILAEAQVKRQGRKLGPVGGRIVAEVFLGLLAGDPASYLSVDPDWKPASGKFGAGAGGKFGFAELLRFAVPAQTQP